MSPLPGTYRYLSGASVTVTATPNEGYRVASWGGDCSGTATCTLTMNANRTASVTFARITHTLTVTAGEGGSVSPAPGTYRYDEDEQVTVTATPDAGYRVTSWGGDCSGSGTNVICALTMDGNKTASVTFEQGTAYTTDNNNGRGRERHPRRDDDAP